MKDIFTLKRIITFLGIIGIGIIGLMVADSFDYREGREVTENTIGIGAMVTTE